VTRFWAVLLPLDDEESAICTAFSPKQEKSLILKLPPPPLCKILCLDLKSQALGGHAYSIPKTNNKTPLEFEVKQ